MNDIFTENIKVWLNPWKSPSNSDPCELEEIKKLIAKGSTKQALERLSFSSVGMDAAGWHKVGTAVITVALHRDNDDVEPEELKHSWDAADRLAHKIAYDHARFTVETTAVDIMHLTPDDIGEKPMPMFNISGLAKEVYLDPDWVLRRTRELKRAVAYLDEIGQLRRPLHGRDHIVCFMPTPKWADAGDV